MRLTYEAILKHPDLLARTLAEARRARAEAVHRFIKRIFGQAMYDHIGLHVKDLDAAQRFYRAALEPLGHAADDSGVGFGPRGAPALWLHANARAKGGAHVALRADQSPTCYAAFLSDPDGNNVEAVCLTE